MSTTTPSQQQGHRAADLVRLLQTAFPRDWEKHLRILGVTDPADLSPAELAKFTDEVFWRVTQTGIKRPRRLARHSSGSDGGVYGSADSGRAQSSGGDCRRRHLGATGLRRARVGHARDGPGENLKSSATEAGGSNAHEPDENLGRCAPRRS